MSKVIHLVSNRWHSAITEYAISAAKALNIHGIENELFAKNDSAAFSAMAAQNLSVSGIPDFGLMNYGKIATVIKKLDSSSAIICYGGAEFSFAKCCFPMRKVLRFRGEYPRGLSAKSSTLRALATHISSATIYPSRFLKAHCGDVSQKSYVIEIGRDRKIFYPAQANSRGHNERPSVLVLGRFDPVKGHQKIFEIFSAAMKLADIERLNPILKIVGEPKNVSTEQLHSLARSCKLVEGQDYEIVDQRVSDIAKIIRESCVGVVPSIGSELICRVSHEFSLSGVPIFVSGVGSLQEALFDSGGSSYLGMTNEIAAKHLAEQLNLSINEDVSVKSIRAEAAANRFSLETMGRALLRVLQI